MLWLLIGFAGACALGVWVYNDAERRQMDSAPLWGIGTTLLAILVLPLYLIVRAPEYDPDRDPAQMRTCPHCAERIKRAAKVCRYCQREVPAPTSVQRSAKGRATGRGRGERARWT